MILKRRQIVVLSIILMVIVAGYLQYNYNGNSALKMSNKVNGRIGEAVYVENTKVKETETETASPIDEKNKKSATVGSFTKDYFAEAKMDREITRGKNKDALKEIAEDTNASKDVKSDAYNQILKLTQNSEREAKIESLIKQKGMENAIVYFGDDGSLDIIVKSPDLIDTQVAQITDIVSRFSNVGIDKIHIKNIK